MKADRARTGSTIRCAIYTRNCPDQALAQEFNSLDAQREACEAYIVSQRHAGWIALKRHVRRRRPVRRDDGAAGPQAASGRHQGQQGSNRRCLQDPMGRG